MSHRATTRRNQTSDREPNERRINHLAVVDTGRYPTKRFRLPLALPSSSWAHESSPEPAAARTWLMTRIWSSTDRLLELGRQIPRRNRSSATLPPDRNSAPDGT